MNAIDRVQLLAELDHESCELNHGPGTELEKIPASDYVVIPMGYKENEISEVAVRELVIPVCYDCAQALTGNDWTLLYCFECASSHWIYRRLAKNKYRHHILWLRGCPECTDEFNGLYFNDMPTIEGATEFLTHYMKSEAA